MANQILHKRKTTTGAGGTLAAFEIAINSFDEQLYIANTAVSGNILVGTEHGTFGVSMAATANSAAGTALLDTFSTSTTTKGLVAGSNGGGATVFLNGNNAWSVPGGGGDVSKVGTPVDNEMAVWTGDGTLEGEANFIYTDGATTGDQLTLTAGSSLTSGSAFKVTADLAALDGGHLVDLIVDNTGSTSGVLRLQQDGTGDMLVMFDGATEAFTVNQVGKIDRYGGAATSTNRAVLVSDGTDLEARVLVELDISNLQSYLLPSDIGTSVQGYDVDTMFLDQAQTMTALLTLSGDPTTNLMAATKQYVDAVAQGLTHKTAVRVCTAGALPAYTQAGAGVGATLTADSVGVVTVDGQDLTAANSFSVGDRVLVNEDGSAADADSGIYTITTLSAAGVALVLTRATDADATAELDSAHVFVNIGSTLADTSWVQTATVTTVDTTAHVWAQFSSAGQHTASSVATTYHIWKQTVGNDEEFRGVDNAANGGLAFTTTASDIEIAIDVANVTTDSAIDGAVDHLLYSNGGTTRKVLGNDLMDGGTWT